MKLHVEIMSSEMVKPSTPTPKHVKLFKLSLFDQFFQFTYVPHILFYKPTPSSDGIEIKMSTVELLKKSLSQSLSIFYPLAGRLTADESTIDCNDSGVPFVIAKAHGCSITSVLENVNRVNYIGRFLSKNHYCDNENKNGGDTNVVSPTINVTKLRPLTIQVTTFECGGVVIGSQWLHKVCDGATWGNFLKTWAAFAAKHNENVITPNFKITISLFPPRDNYKAVQSTGIKVRTLVPLDDNKATQVLVDGLCIVKAFTFTSEATSALQIKGTSDDVRNPTRVEALSGFIWKHAMAAAVASRASSSSSSVFGSSALTHAVNIRHRFHPPLSSTTFGNIFIDTIASYTGDLVSPSLQELIHRIRKSLSKAKDAEFLNTFQGEGGGEVLYKYKQNITDIFTNADITPYKFTSWSGLNMRPDFGFGPPSWTGFTGGRLSNSFKNLVILIDTCNGGIEAWLILDEQEMGTLLVDEDFLEFAMPSFVHKF
ncbi:hypothetical protein vseg_016321 [Gypsophila vaccaria]